MAVTWDDAVLHALSLPDTELGTSYGKPAVKIASNGRAFLFFGREPETSFGVALDLDTIEMLKDTDATTFWQTPHYEGWPAVLVRYASPDPDRVYSIIERSRDWIAAKTKVKPRSSS